MRGERGVGEEELFHLVLEDGTADGDAEGLAKGAEERVHCDGEGEVGVRGRGLDGKGHAGKEDAGAEATDQVEEDPFNGGSMHVEEVEEARTDGGEGPAGPDGPPVAAGEGDDEACDHGCGSDGEGFGKHTDACKDGGLAFDGFVVKG